MMPCVLSMAGTALHGIERFVFFAGRVRTAPPGSPIRGAHNQIGAPDHLRLLLAEERRQPRLELILVGDQQVTARAVPGTTTEAPNSEAEN